MGSWYISVGQCGGLDLEREELPVYKWYQLWELGKLHGEIIEKIVGNTEQRPED